MDFNSVVHEGVTVERLFRDAASKAKVHPATVRKIRTSVTVEGECIWYTYDSYQSASAVHVRKKGGSVHMCAFLRALWLGIGPEAFVKRGFRHTCGGGAARPPGSSLYRVCVRPEHVLVEGEEEGRDEVVKVGEKRTWDRRAELEKERAQCREELLEDVLCEVDDPDTVRHTGENVAASKGRAYLKYARYGDTNIARVLAPPRNILGMSRADAKKLIHEVHIRSAVLEETTPQDLLLALPPSFDSLLVFTEENLAEMRKTLEENDVPYREDEAIEWGLIVEKRRKAAESLPRVEELPDFDANVRDVEVVGASAEGFAVDSEDTGLLRYPFGGRETWQRIYEEARKERETPEPPRPPPRKRVRFAEQVEVFRPKKIL